MPSLFDSLHFDSQDVLWRPNAPPSLAGIREIEIDTETSGLRWWHGDRPIGISICLPDGSTQYLPFGHKGGGNLDESVVKRWAQQELRGKRLTGLNIRFDIHHLREWGVDLEAQDCEVSDVSHYVALLDDHRQHFSLESLSRDFLGFGKLGQDLDKTRMADYHAGQVAPYAERDAELVQKLKKVLLPRLEAEDLLRVKALEDQVIYVVCEMEKNAAVIDVELLNTWAQDCEQQYLRCLWEISREARVHNFSPNSAKSWAAVFKHEGIPITEFTEAGAPSFKDVTLKKIENKNVQLCRHAGKLAALKSKYLDKYVKNVSADGKMRYALHQLRAQKDEFSDHGEAGTISGRFASTEICKGEGVNQQQVMKVEKQIASYGDQYLIRQLYKPEDGKLFFSADAMQIEYRLFAHYTQSPRLIGAYRDDPKMSFHKYVWGLIKPHKPDITYTEQKNLNFAKVYAAGLKKIALMLEFITPKQFAELTSTKASNAHPLLDKAREVLAIYDRELPEVSPLLKMVTHLAMPECSEFCRSNDELHRKYPHRGFVRTMYGRRSRFPDGFRVHKALNAVIQGTAADILKMKLVELHKHRKDTGFLLRWTSHDDVSGDVPDEEAGRKVTTLLDQQSLDLRVPILWEGKTGATWRDCA